MGQPAKVLVVEDDAGVVELLVRALEREGFEVEVTDRGAEAPTRVEGGDVDIVLLDLNLPDADGLDVCRRIRERLPALPVVMLTGRGSELDVVAGLEAGAHDYVSKPFSVAELIARMHANLRPSGHAAAVPLEGRLELRGLVVERTTRRVERDGRDVDLTPAELDVLAVLVADTGRVVSRERIVEHLRREHGAGSNRSLDMHISSLRKKLGDDEPTARLITTVRGVGFRFEDGP